MSSNKEKSKRALILHRIEELCSNPIWFKGWKADKVLQIIKSTLKIHNNDQNLLHKDIDINEVSHRQNMGEWHYGYCYIIARVAKLILEATKENVRYKPLFKPDSNKRALKAKTHWILQSREDGSIFDCAGVFPSAHYEGFTGRGIQRHPTISARILFQYVLKYCIETNEYIDPRQIELVEKYPSQLRDLENELSLACSDEKTNRRTS